jgi:acetyl esterase/lipase
MGERPTIKLIDNPIAVGDAGPAIEQQRPSPPRRSRTRRERPAAAAPTAPEASPSESNPYAGQHKTQAPVRLFPPLWERLEQLVRELRDEGLETDKTAMLNAVLHFHGPRDLDQASDLVNRWRALLARPPAPRA